MDKKNVSAACGPTGKFANFWIFPAAFVLGLLIFCADKCPAQNVPITELVPLQDLEVRTTDLIRLAEAYSDVLRDLRIAQLNLEALSSLSASTVVSQLEIRIAKLNVLTAERKLKIYRAIAEKELAATKAKLEIIEQMEKIGEKSDQASSPNPTTQNRFRIAQARCIIAILQMIMEPISK